MKSIVTVYPFFLLLVAVALIPDGYAQSQRPVSARDIVETMDELYRSDASYSEVAMTIVTPHWERTLEMNVWTKGMDRTFIRITAPPKERGVGTLRIDNEMWNYLPKVNKVIKIPPSMMMSSWMGSDFTNDDLVSEFTFLDDYTFRLIEVNDAVADVLYVECRPREGRPIIWSRVVLAVRAEDYLPIWEKYYDEDNEVVRELKFSDIKTMDGRLLPATLTMIPHDEEGRTVINYKSIQFNPDLGNDIFTLRHLRSRI